MRDRIAGEDATILNPSSDAGHYKWRAFTVQGCPVEGWTRSIGEHSVGNNTFLELLKVISLGSLEDQWTPP